MSRLSSLFDDTDGDGVLDTQTPEDVYSAYKYLGLGQIVEEDNRAAKLSYLNSAGNVTGLDRFGRIVDQVWKDASNNVLDRYTYTYDRAGNRTTRVNALVTDHSRDERYEYDDLARLTAWYVAGSQTPTQTWTLDSLGNNLSAGSYNAANEETPTGQSGNPYDTAGNMTALKSGMTAVYDAWNRLKEVDNGSSAVERYDYDGTNRRIRIYSDFSGTPATTVSVQDDYYLGQQVVESRKQTGYDLSAKTGTAAGGYQYLWSPRYIDSPIFRDSLTANWSGILTPDENRILYVADANFNITGLIKKVGGTWQPVERYSYTPYGEVTVRAATDWSALAQNVSQFANTLLYTGKALSWNTLLQYNLARYYDAAVERFINRDPIGYKGGDPCLYRYVHDNPLTYTDPLGLKDVCGPRVWLYTGDWCADESVWDAATAAAGEVVTCWWNCEVTTHKCIGGALVPAVTTVSGVLSIPGARIPKSPGLFWKGFGWLPKVPTPTPGQWNSVGPVLGQKAGVPKNVFDIIKWLSRKPTTYVLKGALVTTVIVEGGISANCSYKCGKQNGLARPMYIFKVVQRPLWHPGGLVWLGAERLGSSLSSYRPMVRSEA